MAYTTIDNPSDYFEVLTYTGNNSSRSITGLDFQPDWIWTKDRSGGNDHQLIDAVRGTSEALSSNRSDVNSFSDGVTAFNSDGYSLGNNTRYNGSSVDYVSWNWKAGNGTASNSNGSITSTVSANTTAGFSIVTFNGNDGTVGHGLGQKPDVIIVKSRQTSNNFVVFHKGLGSMSDGSILVLNSTNAEDSAGSGFSEPTSSVFTIKSGAASNDNNVAYVFAEKQGYSKYGLFRGNNSSDGAFIYTGFKPRWLMVKNATQSHANHSWIMFDSKRHPNNFIDIFSRANADSAEVTSGRNEVDFLSNGFKPRQSYGDFNGGSNHLFVYLAIAEEPFVSSSGVPTTAR